MTDSHQYKLQLNWTGNLGMGTSSYKTYSRNHIISTQGKSEILGSSDPSFRGDPLRYNPEEMLVASIASCHMLWFLHLCSESGITVIEYQDEPVGTMTVRADGGGAFSSVELYPRIKILEKEKADDTLEIHDRAHELCFIANSCNFPITHEPLCVADDVL